MKLTKLNIAEFARMTGLNYRTVYSYVNGERRPSPEIALLMAETTGDATPDTILAFLSKDPAKIKEAIESSLISD